MKSYRRRGNAGTKIKALERKRTTKAEPPAYSTTRKMTTVVEFGEAIKNPAYRILQTEYSGCLDISAHA